MAQQDVSQLKNASFRVMDSWKKVDEYRQLFAESRPGSRTENQQVSMKIML